MLILYSRSFLACSCCIPYTLFLHLLPPPFHVGSLQALLSSASTFIWCNTHKRIILWLIVYLYNYNSYVWFLCWSVNLCWWILKVVSSYQLFISLLQSRISWDQHKLVTGWYFTIFHKFIAMFQLLFCLNFHHL